LTMSGWQAKRNLTSSKQPLVAVWLRTSELRFAPFLTFDFGCQLRRDVAGPRRHSADHQLSNLPSSNLVLTALVWRPTM
jgi:hypothetical protein